MQYNIKKIFLTGLFFSLMFALPAKAETIDELMVKINALKSQINQLQSPSNSTTVQTNCNAVTFSRTLKVGSVGQDVKCLQALLNQDLSTQIASRGSGSPGQENTYFGNLTKAALIKFQQKYASEILTPNGMIRGNGIVGLSTAAKLNALINASRIPAATTAPIAPASPTATLSATGAIAKVNPSVVSIVVSKQAEEYQVSYQDPFGNGLFRIQTFQPTGRIVNQTVGSGSGLLITADGYLITNNHLIIDPKYTYTITLTTGATQIAQVVHQDAAQDIAILKIEGVSYPMATLGDSNNLQLGQTVIAIGNALGQFSNTVSVGIVSGLNRTIQANNNQGGVETLQNIIQTDAAINPGNSGGPLLDLNGNVVGINVATVQGSSNISFALPINPVKNIIRSVLGR